MEGANLRKAYLFKKTTTASRVTAHQTQPQFSGTSPFLVKMALTGLFNRPYTGCRFRFLLNQSRLFLRSNGFLGTEKANDAESQNKGRAGEPESILHSRTQTLLVEQCKSSGRLWTRLYDQLAHVRTGATLNKGGQDSKAQRSEDQTHNGGER